MGVVVAVVDVVALLEEEEAGLMMVLPGQPVRLSKTRISRAQRTKPLKCDRAGLAAWRMFVFTLNLTCWVVEHFNFQIIY